MKSNLTRAEPVSRFPYQECFAASAKKYDVPLLLLLAVARGESDFDPQAISSANARGLMQILWPITAHHLGLFKEGDLFEPCTNIDAGARYLRELSSRYNGDIHLVLAAYYYGPNRIAVGAKLIPEKAAWYSSYIYDHLEYVAGLESSGSLQIADYSGERKITIIEFQHPYLADIFKTNVETKAPQVRLDLFKTYFDRYRVVLLYVSDEEYRRSRRALERAGFRLEDHNEKI